MVHGIDAVRGIALPKPVAASLLWYTTAATQVFSIIQTCRRVPALIHAQARFRPSLLHKAFALTLLWCMGLTRRKASHHPNPPPRACFGTRPSRCTPSASSKPFSASLLLICTLLYRDCSIGVFLRWLQPSFD